MDDGSRSDRRLNARQAEIGGGCSARDHQDVPENRIFKLQQDDAFGDGDGSQLRDQRHPDTGCDKRKLDAIVVASATMRGSKPA